MTPLAPQWIEQADVIVVGSGAAGLTTAITARNLGLSVVVLTKAQAGAGATRSAIGGIAAVVAEDSTTDDSIESHLTDTLAAGSGLSDPDVTEMILRAAPAAIQDLTRLDMPWDRDPRGPHLARTREGGHSAPRVLHAQDATGRALSETLLHEARAAAPHGGARIVILEHHTVVDLLHTEDRAVVGVLALDPDGRWGLMTGAVVLATGGIGQIYQATTNPDGSVGDGLALALRAEARLGDMEFVQFHPTALYTGPGYRGQLPLVTEAVRGHDTVRPAVLVDATGARVMEGVHPLADLAPRDVVAIAISRRMVEQSTDHVFLDATHLDPDVFKTRFPTVHSACRSISIDPSQQPIPVTPAQHCLCGGILSTPDGRTGVTGLYAVGEAARSGMHGANRLASNSLTEALVMGARVARAVHQDHRTSRLTPSAALRVVAVPTAPIAPLQLVQATMTRYVGMDRSADGLAAATATLAAATTVRPLESPELVEAASALLVARAVITAAAAREESRGCHQRRDFPHRARHRYGQDLVTVSLTPGAGKNPTVSAWWSERSTG